MKRTNFFTLHPSPPYFTFPFHLRQSSRSFVSNSVPTIAQADEIANRFRHQLFRFLEIPEDFHLVIFNSIADLNTVLADTYFSNRSYHPVHGTLGKHFCRILMTRRLNPIEHQINFPGKDIKSISIPVDVPIYITLNEPDSGSCIGPDFLKSISSKSTHQFVHADLTSMVPGVRMDPGTLQSFSFAFNTSFGIPLNNAVWLISPTRLEDFMLKFGDRYPGNEFAQLQDKCYYSGSPDYLFMDVAQKVIEDLENKGLKNIVNETIYKAKTLEESVSGRNTFQYLTVEDKFRSATTIVLGYTGKLNNISEILSRNGIEVDTLINKPGLQQIRITNFPVHSREQFEMLADQIAKMD
jgi:phosphoserine aminotransferase